MSMNPSNIIGVNLPIKIFVKESNCNEESRVKKVNNDLGFKGLEAKIAYDETISQDFRSQDNDQNHKAVQKIISRRNRSKLRCMVKQKIIKNVTVNSVFKAIEQKDMSFLETNLHAGNVNMSDEFGWTPLMSAAYAGNLHIVEFLLKLGAKRKIREKSGLTAEQLASKNKFTSVIELLASQNKNNDSLKNVGDLPKSIHSNIGIKKMSESSKEKNFSGKSSFYCNICDSEFKGTTVMEHESSIVHVFNTKPIVREAHYVVPKGNKGYQMLINSGWDEEHGLGPSGEGRKYPIKTTLKQDRKGLGLDKKSTAKVTHFKAGDYKAVKRKRAPNEKTMKKWERENHLKKEARKEKALRQALS